jgi:nitroreductase
VDDAIVLRCIELALKAPTGSNGQNWEFIVVKDPEVKQRLGLPGSVVVVRPGRSPVAARRRVDAQGAQRGRVAGVIIPPLGGHLA